MKKLNKFILKTGSFVVFLLTGVWPVFASNTGGVPAPTIKPHEKTLSYRVGYSPSENSSDEIYIHRMHLQQSFSKTSRWRIIGQMRDVGSGNEYDELRIQYHKVVDTFFDFADSTAIRFDLRTRKGSRPEQASLVWTNQWKFSPNLAVTGVLLGHWQFAGNANPGTRMEVRYSAAYDLGDGARIAVEGFSDLGDVGEQSGIDNQKHSLGVMYSTPTDWGRLHVGYLAGLSSPAPEHTLRLWWSYSV